ncbi:MAG: phosphoribosylglycinamide formyltransferase [Clostridia bacterium]|nr:phosphoribosylglycinamide formyltransferase [Clostridia bacterium]
MKKTRIAVLVSGGGTNLQALLDAEKNGIIKSGGIVLVVSDNKNAYALTRAANAGVKAEAVDRKEYPDPAKREAVMIDILRKHDADMIVLAGFLSILSGDFIRSYENRIINIHPSLIPSFCGKGFYGLKVHEAALERGVKVTGATVHYVNEIPDGGRIIMQKAVPVCDGDTPEILQRRVMEEAEWIILPKAVELVARSISEKGAE